MTVLFDDVAAAAVAFKLSLTVWCGATTLLLFCFGLGATHAVSLPQPLTMATSGMMPRVAVFTSIPNIGETLLLEQQAFSGTTYTSLSSIDIDIIHEPTLDDGIANFDATMIKDTSRQALSQAEILICEPAILAKLLRHDPQCVSNLKWCQLTFAGVDALLNDSVFEQSSSSSKPPATPSFRLTRFAGMFGQPIAEWCLARIIGHERKFALSAVHQSNRQWTSTSRAQVENYRYLNDLTLSLLGCGDIGLCIAKAAKAFGMTVVGYVKTVRKQMKDDDGIDEYTTDLSTALRKADYIVSVLPSTPQTRGLLGGEAMNAASPEAGGKCPVLINVGRGDLIDEASLIHALNRKYISAAILDVFGTEPLSPDSDLWSRPDMVISPHVCGLTQAKDVPKVFLENYRRYLDGDELLYEVDWSKGY